VVVGLARDLGEKALAEVPARPRRQLHREEGHVPGRVPAPEARAELDAVDGDRLAGLEVDVLEPKVAVAVPDAALPDPLLEACRLALQGP
jgi:hypothetical protein